MENSEQLDYNALPTAGLFRRIAALLYDGFLVLAIWFIMGFIVQLMVGTESNQLVDGQVQTSQLLDNILFILMLGSSSIFYIWFWKRSGQTLGMIAWKIKALSNGGGLMTTRQGIIRFCCAWPAFFIAGLGYFWLFIDSKGDAVHDKLSNTKVVTLPKDYKPFK